MPAGMGGAARGGSGVGVGTGEGRAADMTGTEQETRGRVKENIPEPTARQCKAIGAGALCMIKDVVMRDSY